MTRATTRPTTRAMARAMARAPHPDEHHPDRRPEDQQALLEQYKLYVTMADQTSERRVSASKFYTSLLTILLALLAFSDRAGLSVSAEHAIRLVAGALGICLCAVWFANVHSYRQLNSGRYKVIQEMERRLPFACYTREWELLAKGKDWMRYWTLARVERLVPIVFGLVFSGLVAYYLIPGAHWLLAIVVH